jgi:hypothetical protein
VEISQFFTRCSFPPNVCSANILVLDFYALRAPRRLFEGGGVRSSFYCFIASAMTECQSKEGRLQKDCGAQRPILNIAPRGKCWPQGRSCSFRGEFCPLGVKLSSRGEILFSTLHSSKQLRVFTPEGDEGVKIPLGDKFHPRGWISPLGAREEMALKRRATGLGEFLPLIGRLFSLGTLQLMGK